MIVFWKNTWLYMVCNEPRKIPLTQKYGISLSYLAFILLYNSLPDWEVFSYIGYISQSVEIQDRNQPLQITLEEDAQRLDEVVVTALGIKRQSRSLRYSTTQVGGNEFTMARDSNSSNALFGKIAGVSVSLFIGSRLFVFYV